MSEAGSCWNPSKNEGASADIQEFAATTPVKSVLDLGCGTGRNLVPFDRPGTILHGVDSDEESVTRARARLADSQAGEVNIEVADIRSYEPSRTFDLVICYGVLHFLSRHARVAVYEKIRSWVTPGGYAAVVLFNALVPIPADLRELMPEPPEDSSELLSAFDGWRTEKVRSYVYDDEHDGGIRHVHSIDRLIAQSPEGTH